MENINHTAGAAAPTTTTAAPIVNTTTAAPTTTYVPTVNTTTAATPNTTLPTLVSQIPTTRAQGPVSTEAQTLSFREKLDAGEEYWIWKISLRALLLLVSVIGIGCIGWAVTSSAVQSYTMYMSDQDLLWGPLITFAISIIWTLLCILVLLLRRPNRPVHPGVAVGMDLILWLAYIFTTGLAALACVALVQFGADGFINKDISDGYYTQYPNGTWVYNATEYAQSYNTARTCNGSSSRSYSYYSYSLPSFDNCEQQDAFVNLLWTSTKHRASVVLTGTVCQGLAFLLHFMLFVWACVDTHRRNKKKTNVDAEKLAADIIGRMVRDGAIVHPPGHAQPMQGRYQQLPNHGPQTYLQQPWYDGQRAGNGQPAQAYTVHQGPPPPLPTQVHPAMRGAAQGPPSRAPPPLPSITEHYAPAVNEKGQGLGGPGPVRPVQTVVEHYGGNEKAGGSSGV